MIFLMSEKGFIKHDKKLIKVKDYLIMDGSDAGDIDDRSLTSDISATYANVIINGGFTPHHRLIEAIKKDKKKGIKDLSWKTQNMMNDFFEDKSFVGAVTSAVKGFTMEKGGWDTQWNVFIVLPNKVYNTMADYILARFHKLMGDVEFRFIYSEVEVLENMKLLKKDLKDKKLAELRARIPKLVKKYKLQ